MALVIISTVLFYYRLTVRTKNEEMESKMGQIRELSDEIRAKDNSLFALNKRSASGTTCQHLSYAETTPSTYP